MFERFTEKAIKVIMLSQEESRRLGHHFVGTEVLLLGLIGENSGVAAKTLSQLGVNLKPARREAECQPRASSQNSVSLQGLRKSHLPYESCNN